MPERGTSPWIDRAPVRLCGPPHEQPHEQARKRPKPHESTTHAGPSPGLWIATDGIGRENQHQDYCCV